MIFKWIPLILFLPVAAVASSPDLSFLCERLLQSEPAQDIDDRFTETFKQDVPFATLIALFRDLSSETGACTSFQISEIRPNVFRVQMAGKKGIHSIWTVFLEETGNRISGLRLEGIEDPTIHVGDWAELESNLQRLDPNGGLSATLITPDRRVNLKYRGSEALAVGSTFKLYVLGTLIDAIGKGERRWEDTLAIREDWKSLPSGIMQNWPVGKEVPLETYAANMISESDNTATDHLIRLLGRERVEEMYSTMGNNSLGRFDPLPTTLELFKLKWAITPEQASGYLSSDRPARLKLLESLTLIPNDRIFSNGVDPMSPTLIDQMEWFASTEEACQAMFWLAAKDEPKIRNILGIHVPVLDDVGSATSHWAYAGYKGGSEPGVLNLTYLLESKQGSRACLSMTWNNSKQTLNTARFLDIVKKALSFAESQVP